MHNRAKSFLFSLIYKMLSVINKIQLSQQDSSQVLTIHLRRLAIEDSAVYIRKNMKSAMVFKSREDFWKYSLSKRQINGLNLEFGVHRGNSINFLAELLPEAWYGFDSFIGLKDDWHGTSLPKGGLDLKGKLPAVCSNVSLIAGYFEDTLSRFLENRKEVVSVLHIDSDTYPAAKFVLNGLAQSICPGTLVIFDEYFGYHNWEQGEFLAFKEFVQSKGLTYSYIACTQEQVAILIL